MIGSRPLKAALVAAGVRLAKPELTVNERAMGPEQLASVELDPSISHVVVGFERDFCYYHFAYAVRCLLELPACTYLVTNRDYQFPTKGCRLPGNGMLVAAVSAGAAREPDLVCAKPSPWLLKTIMASEGVTPERTLMVGDMWSDIAFAHRAGACGALVLSGVATEADVATWTGDSVPDAVLRDVRGLVAPSKVVSTHGHARPMAARLRDAATRALATRGGRFALLGLGFAAAGAVGAGAVLLAARSGGSPPTARPPSR